MKNQVTLHADQVLRIYDPKLSEQVKHLIVVNAANPENLAAIDSLLCIIENTRSFGVRRRFLRQATVQCLLNLAVITCDNLSCFEYSQKAVEISRMEFANLLGNDYNILRYWGLITQGKQKGFWQLTQFGMRFLLHQIAIPDHILCHGGAHVGNYTFEQGSHYVTVEEMLPKFHQEIPTGRLMKLLQRAVDPNDPLEIPVGHPLPDFVFKRIAQGEG